MMMMMMMITGKMSADIDDAQRCVEGLPVVPPLNANALEISCR